MLFLPLLVLNFAAPEPVRFALEDDDFSLQPHVSDLQVDDQGLIYVADTRELVIRVFDQTGRQLRTLGRRGEGPGELKRWFGTFAIVDGRLYQCDYFGGNRFVNIFDVRGPLIKTIDLKALPPVAGPTLILPHGNDSFLAAYDYDYQGQKQGPLYFLGPMQRFAIIGAGGSLRKLLFEERAVYEISKYPNREGRRLPGSDGMLFAVSRDRQVVVKQRINRSQGVLLNLVNGRQLTYQHGFKPKAVDRHMVEALQKERAAWIDRRWHAYEAKLYQTLAKDIDRYELGAEIVHHLFFSDTHLVVVGAQAADGSYPTHLLDPNDGTLSQKHRFVFIPFHITAERIYGLEINQTDDLYHVRIETR